MTCRFEFEDGAYFDESLPNGLGLDALETILFSLPNVNNCSINSGINYDGDWDAVGAAGIAQARADFADLLTTEIADDLHRIRSAWEGGFSEQLATGGQGSDSFDSSVTAINAIYDGPSGRVDVVGG